MEKLQRDLERLVERLIKLLGEPNMVDIWVDGEPLVSYHKANTGRLENVTYH